MEVTINCFSLVFFIDMFFLMVTRQSSRSLGFGLELGLPCPEAATQICYYLPDLKIQLMN